MYYAMNIGVYGDGSFGHKHVRERLATLVKEANNGKENELWAALRAEPSDDMSEEDDFMTTHATKAAIKIALGEHFPEPMEYYRKAACGATCISTANNGWVDAVCMSMLMSPNINRAVNEEKRFKELSCPDCKISIDAALMGKYLVRVNS